jgi:hypothetical protein
MKDTSEIFQKLNEWIIQVKKDAFLENIKTENSEDLLKYKYYLEELESNLRPAIQTGNIDRLQSLRWPEELMDCINDMTIKYEILDCINQAFTVNHFNKSPKHEEELNEKNKI